MRRHPRLGARREMSGPHHRRLNTELFITDEELVEVMERCTSLVIW